jgi:hypothetical protein
MTRVLINEATNFTHPEYKETGRGFVWGYVDKLKTWETLSDYKALAKPIVPKFNYGHTPGQSIYWSPFEGEENILYAVHRPSTCVVRINVDTQQQTEVISYDPGDGTNVRRARALGLTADHHLIVNFNNEADEGGGFEINLQKKTRSRYTKWPEKWTAEWRRFPNRGHGHGSRSPSGLQLVSHLGLMQKVGVIDTRTGELTRDTGYNHRQKPFPYCSNFGSWLANENWYIVSASVGYGPKQLPVLQAKPNIAELPIWQVYFTDGTFKWRDLMIVKTAGAWKTNKGGKEVVTWNATGFIYPIVRQDGRELYFTCTEGKYTYPDFQVSGEPLDWGTEGAFLAVLEPPAEEM